MLAGLSTINVELTSRCNKACWMCGRRKIERDYPDLVGGYGDMDFDMVQKIADQLPPDIVVQFHNNGEPLLYPKLGEALSLFKNDIRCFNTNGNLLLEKQDEINGNLERLTVSIIENDPEDKEQEKILREYLKRKKHTMPIVVLRFLGKVNEERYKDLDVERVRRVLHSPMGSFDYERAVVKPEHAICKEVLGHPAIDRYGRVSVCVRFDPKHELVIGDLKHEKLRDIWNGSRRNHFISTHIAGKRDALPVCKDCHFWGIPRG